MATLTANITADDEVLPVSAEIPIGDYTIDSEAVHVYGTSRGEQGRAFDRLFVSVERGAYGTTAATHTSGATLTRYYPGAPGGGGAGGVTVDNGTDPPADVTTIVAPGVTIAGDEADFSTWGEVISHPVSIQTDDLGAYRLQVAGADANYLEVDSSGSLSIYTSSNDPLQLLVDEDQVFLVDSDGKALLKANGNNAPGHPALAVDALAAVADLFRLKSGTQDIFTVAKSGVVNLNASTGENIFNGGLGGMQFLLQPGATFEVVDASSNPLFKVDADGAVHIKTGTSIVADL